MGALFSDLRTTWRAISRTPIAAIAAMLTCALSLTFAGTIFSIAYAVILRPLPFRDPDRLVWIWGTRTDRDRAFFSLPDYLEHRGDAADVAELVGIANWGANLTGRGEPRRLQGIRTTSNITDVLGIHPTVGRLLERSDDDPSGASIVVLSERIWRDQFGADPRVVGRRVLMNDVPFVVVGVLPRDFLIPGSEVDMVVPLRPSSDPRRTDRDTNFLRMIGRLKADHGTADLHSRLVNTTRRLRTLFPDSNAKKTDPRVLPLQAEIFGAYRSAFVLLLVCGALILLLTTANLLHMMLARLRVSRRSAALRLALGGSRMHIWRLLMLEPLAISVPAAVVGWLLMAWTVSIAADWIPQVPRASDARVDPLTVAGVLAAATLTGIIAGLAPILRLSRTHDVSVWLGDRTYTPAAVVGRRVLVAELGLCLTLLTTALLATATVRSLLFVTPGVDATNVSTMRLSIPPSRYSSSGTIQSLLRRLLDSLRENPDVVSVAVTNVLPLSGMNVRTDFEIDGRPARSAAEVPAAQNRWISEDYFTTMGIPVLRGRAFSTHDAAGSAPVIIIDSILARQFWADLEPIGSRIRMIGLGGDRFWTVVGVAGPVKHQRLDESPTGTLYAPMAQVTQSAAPFVFNSLSVTARLRGGGPERAATLLREAVRQQDAAIPISHVQALGELIDAAVAPQRLTAWLMSALALAAVLIAVFGVAAVTACIVAERRREIAVRIALGSSPRRVCAHLVLDLKRATVVGGAIGVAGAIGLVVGFRGIFYAGAKEFALSTAVALLLISIGTVTGAAVPAWRAARIDAVEALRED